MKIPSSSLMTTLGAALLIFTTLTAASSGQTGAQQQLSGNPADDPANELFMQTCNRCHDAARITALRRTKTEWEEVINKMIERGATGSEEDFMTVFGFLRRHYGKVYINTAPTEEITATLGLTNKDAESIVAFRKANGNFADLDAVKKVPNIDVKILEDHKDAVAF
jgi:competence ComEA-like helix-hairpin-helix protein